MNGSDRWRGTITEAGLQALAIEAAKAGNMTAVNALVVRAARAIARTGRYTTLSGSREWTAADVDDLLADFFSKKGRVEQLVVSATSEQHLRGSVEKSLTRLILDRKRKGPTGVLRSRIERRARARRDVLDVAPKHWSLVGYEANPHWGGPTDVLEQAAAATPVDPPPAWPDDSPRHPPVTTSATVDAVTTRVLTAAAAPLERPLMVTVVAARILPVDPTGVVERQTGAADPLASSPEEVLVEAEADEEAGVVVESIWAGFTDDDRALLPHLLDSSRSVAESGVIPRGRTVINARQKVLMQRLSDLLHHVPDPERVVRLLFDRHAAWLAGRDRGGDS